MGRAMRWFKGLFGIKSSTKENISGDRTTYSRRDAAMTCSNPATITPAEAAWLRSFFNETDKEHSRHAIAVAAATAAAADAAVAAAQAAVAVVRLTSQHGDGGGGRNTYATHTASFGGREKLLAALKIQTMFRGFLARKALRALKGLVKIQALVRGFLVRKQAAATFYSMQALIRAQASVRAQRNHTFTIHKNDNIIRFSTDLLARNSVHKHEEETRISSHSRRPSAASFDQESPKIVEMDTGSNARIPKSRRTSSWWTNPDSIEIESLTIPHQINNHTNTSPLLIPHRRGHSNYWDEEEHCHFSTAQSTPRIASCEIEPGFITPSKSFICHDGSCNGGNKLFHPNYMAKTVSSKAKLRSRSAPRQRLDGGFLKRRLSLHEVMESRNSLRMERSSRSQERRDVAFKNAVTG